MENYDLLDLLSPWLKLVMILVPLFYTERWIHLHFFGVGYLLSRKNAMAATRLFYVFFLPGIFVHEAIQYLVAGAFNVPLKKLVAWPKQQENGTLRLDFIMVEKDKTDRIRAAIVAASPFLVMSALVWYISTQQLPLDSVAAALGAGDFDLMWRRLGDLVKTPQFFFWLYILFVVANSMIPKREDANGLPILVGVLGVITIAMFIVGLDEVLVDTLGGSVADTVNQVNTALVSILGVNCCAIFLLWLTESGIERYLGERMVYGDDQQTRAGAGKENKRIAGSDAPYPKGEPLPSIYNLHLSLPSPDDRSADRPAPQPSTPPMRVRETSPALASAASGEQGERPPRSIGATPAPETVTPSRPSANFSSVRPDQAGEIERPPRPTGSFPAARPGGEQGERPPQQPSERPVRPGSEQGDRPPRPTGSFPAVRPGGEQGQRPSERPPERPPRPDQPASPARGNFEEEREKMFGSNRPQQPSERPARPTGSFPAVSPSSERPAERPPRPEQPASNFASEREKLFGSSRPAPSGNQPSERPARPTGSFSVVRPDQTTSRPAQPAPRPGGMLSPREPEEEDDEDDIKYADFDDDDDSDDADF